MIQVLIEMQVLREFRGSLISHCTVSQVACSSPLALIVSTEPILFLQGVHGNHLTPIPQALTFRILGLERSTDQRRLVGRLFSGRAFGVFFLIEGHLLRRIIARIFAVN